ncbi:hypothetical protein R3P38DRAFT_3193250 [Favolaschia claudopus]|uniref:Uncharacterized protein n=1 Tax=Favolaschia claudopus TaxID=2862362 RepID=A0AAV9ZUV5_9AGAR
MNTAPAHITYAARQTTNLSNMQIPRAPASEPCSAHMRVKSAPHLNPAPHPPAVALPAPFASHSVRTKALIRLESTCMTAVVVDSTVYYSRLQRLAHDN